MARIDSLDFKLNITLESIDFEGEKQGNPYNSNCLVEIYSNDFYGKTSIETSHQKIKCFIDDLCNMYKSLKGNTRLDDFNYGSYINIKCDEVGFFVFDGIIINNTFQKLQFNNRLDQTYIKDFLNELSNELEALKNK